MGQLGGRGGYGGGVGGGTRHHLSVIETAPTATQAGQG